jgi:long-chain acyl-CoA synthetase
MERRSGAAGGDSAVATDTLASAGRAIARLARQLDKALEPTGVSLAQYRALSMIGSGTSASSALAQNLSVSPPTVTAVVDGLVARELVTREPDVGDRRRLTHRLTKTGKRTLALAEDAVDARLVEIAAHFDDPAHAAAAIAALETWNDALGRFREQRKQTPRTTR